MCIYQTMQYQLSEPLQLFNRTKGDRLHRLNRLRPESKQFDSILFPFHPKRT
ncbi:MAG: hypothetical protein ACREPR_07680 [Brasilonema sp.]